MKKTELQTLSLKDFLQKISQLPNTNYNMSNIFSVVNKGSNSYFNLAKTINFNNINSIPDTYYTVYMVQEGDTWTNISYKAYGTINPWWIICKFNNIKNPFTDLIVGKKIKLPTQQLLKELNDLISS